MKMSYDEILQKFYNNSEAFKEALFKEYDIENNPKKDECFRLAWEYGHSSGLWDVYGYFDELVKLIK